MYRNSSYSHDDESNSMTDEFEPNEYKQSLPFIDLSPHMYSKLSRPLLQSSQNGNGSDGLGEKDISYPWSPETLSARNQAGGWTNDRHVSTSSLLGAQYHESSGHAFFPSSDTSLPPVPNEAPMKPRLKTLFTTRTYPKNNSHPSERTFRTFDPTTNEWTSHPSILTTTAARSDAELFDPAAVKHSLSHRKRSGRSCHRPIPLGIVLLMVLCSPGILAYRWAEGRWDRWKRESGSHKRKDVTEEGEEAESVEKARD
jgi:hypothetical protein